MVLFVYTTIDSYYLQLDSQGNYLQLDKVD